MDARGYIAGADAARVFGYRLDPVHGTRLRSFPEDIPAPASTLPQRATKTIGYRVNLPGNALMAMPVLAQASILGCDLAAFLEATLPGGTLTLYGARTAARVAFRWGRAQAGEQPCWALYVLAKRRAAFSETAYLRLDTAYGFAPNGMPLSAVDATALPAISVDGVELGGMVMKHGPFGVTQFRDRLGTVRINALTQDGEAAGHLTALFRGDAGEIRAAYSNGQTIAVAEPAEVRVAA